MGVLKRSERRNTLVLRHFTKKGAKLFYKKSALLKKIQSKDKFMKSDNNINLFI